MEVILLVIIFLILGIVKLRDILSDVSDLRSNKASIDFRKKFEDRELEESIRKKLQNSNDNNKEWEDVSAFLMRCPDCDLQMAKRFAFSNNKTAKRYYIEKIAIPILMAKRGKIPQMLLSELYVAHGDKLLGSPISVSVQFAKNLVSELRNYDPDIDLMLVKWDVGYQFYWNKNSHRISDGNSVCGIDI